MDKYCEYTESGYVENQYPRFLYKAKCGFTVCQMDHERWDGIIYIKKDIVGNCMKCGKPIKIVKN